MDGEVDYGPVLIGTMLFMVVLFVVGGLIELWQWVEGMI